MNDALTPEIRETARWMADELVSQRLRVVLVPDWFEPDGVRQLRAVEEQNPGWYRAFCAAFPANRRRPRRRRISDTAIKRRHTLRALHELAEGKCRSEYAQRLLSYVQDEVARSANEQSLYRAELFDEHETMVKSSLIAYLELIG